jgi:acetoin utilization deacetylase AcuC-like enzyme
MVTRRQFLEHSSGALWLVVAAAPGLAQAPAGPTLVLSDLPAMLRHQPSAGHPESPARLEAVAGAINESRLTLETPRPATEDEVLRVHTADYLKNVRTEIEGGRRTLSTGDTEISSGSLGAALTAAGTIVSGVDAVMSGKARRAFCAVRPPGHHASASRGMGFCVFNNIAIGARHAQRRHGVERILIADWDVHHGNGTQDVFWSDGSVLFFDVHQHPWYPGTGLLNETGDGKARGLIFNRPFPAGSGRKEILTAFREALVPAADRFKPQLVMISAGFDSRIGDPLGQFTLTDADFAELTDTVVEIARSHAGGRVVSVLEGGYSLDGLSRAVRSHLNRLAV